MRNTYAFCDKCGKGTVIKMDSLGQFTITRHSWDRQAYFDNIPAYCKKCNPKRINNYKKQGWKEK